MKNIFQLKVKLIMVVMLPLFLIGLTSIVSINILEKSNFKLLLEDKYRNYDKTLQSLIVAKGDFLNFSAALVRQNKKLISSIKIGNSQLISANIDNVWNQISDGVQVLFVWQHGEEGGHIPFSVGGGGGSVNNFSAPLLEYVSRSKRAAFGVEKFPDGNIRLMQASPYFNTPDTPYNLVVQGMDFSIIIDELQDIVGSADIVLLNSAPPEAYSDRLDIVQKIAKFGYPLRDVSGTVIGAIIIEENVADLLAAFQKSRVMTLGTFSLLFILSLFLIYSFLHWLGGRTESILAMLTQVSNGQFLPPPKRLSQPDELDRIINGIREQSATIQSSHAKLLQAKEIAEKEVLERKLAQENLIRIGNQNRTLLECAGEGIYGLDLNGLTTFINPAGSRMIGWHSADLIGKPQHEIMHHTREDGSNYPHEACPIFAAINKGEIQHVVDEIFWRKDGSSFPVEYTSTPVLEDEKIIGAVVVFRDISERKLAEQRAQRLLSSQEVLNAIYQISFEPISMEEQLGKALQEILSIPWLFEQSKGAVFLTSGAGETILKMAAQVGLHTSLLKACATIPYGCCICGRAAQTQEIIHVDCIDDRHEITYEGIQEHGHYAVPLLSGSRLLGVLTLYVSHGHEQNLEEINLLVSVGNSLASMIERKRGEERLLNINQELEQRVQRRTIELQDYVENLKTAQEQLIQSERMAALGGLVAGIAHEINTPVGIGYTSITHLASETRRFRKKFSSGGLLAQDLGDYLQEVDDSTGLILSNLDRAGDLVKSFKAVAVDQTSQEKREFNLKKYLDEVILSLQPKFKNTNHQIKIECQENIILDSWPGAISQILTNLVLNTLTYGFSGVDSGWIVINGSVESGVVSLVYSDNGVGMERDTVKQIYEPFFTTQRNNGGSGLGMHIVFNLVTQRLKGSIECKSAPDRGTTFTIIFPATIGFEQD
ncbi:MAG: PAS domain S-box protein [Magnetococcales bacterium]|nr:PAS domain S-box protein [Magnetococcales bacterium]